LAKPRLQRAHDVMQGGVGRGEVPAMSRSLSAGKCMSTRLATAERDAIFRISPMTKPVTAVAAMMLANECKPYGMPIRFRRTDTRDPRA
jgi:hypothetical protein